MCVCVCVCVCVCMCVCISMFDTVTYYYQFCYHHFDISRDFPIIANMFEIK